MSLSARNPQPAPGLQRLIFFSETAAASPAELDRQLQDIVQASIRNNHDAAVTGFLIAHEGWFLQALEGPKAAVAATYERIAADSRHRSLKMVVSRPSEQRCFAGWTLSARRLAPADEAMLKLFGQAQRFQPAQLSAKNALALLMTASQKPARSVLWLE